MLGRAKLNSMTKEICTVCRNPRAYTNCALCESALCKSCEHFQETDAFSFLEELPEDLKHGHYCPNCFDEKVAPVQAKYEETMALAREVNIFFIADKHPPYLLKSAKRQVSIKDCKDREETILRLGFKAAEMGFNSVAKVNITSTQIRNLGYQTSSWHGTGLPADIDLAKFLRSQK